VTGLLQDVRFAVRQLFKRPVWSLTVISVLALGIGANVGMFSGIDAWVLRPLDFEAPERLVSIGETRLSEAGSWLSVSAPNLADLEREQRSCASLGAFSRHTFNLNDPEQPARLFGARVSHTLFPTLGKAPVLGRGFRAEEDTPGQPAPVALISQKLWKERFGQDPQIVGRTVRLDGQVHEIVGVMEPGFLFPEWAEVWTPLGVDPATARGNRWLAVIGRLRPGKSVSAAGEELAALGARLAEAHPESNQGFGLVVRPLRRAFVPEVIDTALMASLAAGLCVLLVICANVASLMLARAHARQRESAIRAALGASRGRLVVLSLVEGLLLAVPAGVLGSWLGLLFQRYITSWVPVDPPYLFALRFSPRVGAYTLAISLLAGIVCGLAPLLRGTAERLLDALKAGGAVAGEGRKARLGRQALVAGELALSTALVAAALLMVKSFLALQHVDRGHRTQGVMVATLSLSESESDQARIDQAERLLTALEEAPGFERVGLTSTLPVSGWYRTWELLPYGESRQREDETMATVAAIAGDYRRALDIPLLSGRDFDSAEVREGAAVALVSARLARELWGDADPLGRQLGTRNAEAGSWLTVVGVVGDVDYGRDMVDQGTVPEAQLYVPYGRMPTPSLSVAAFGGQPAGTAAAALRAAFRSGAPGTPFSEVLTLDQAIFRERWVSEFFSRLLALYAAGATLIAALGLYGLTVETTSRRTRELAVRLALGARRRTLVGMIVREALHLGLLGVGLGLLLTALVSGFGAAMLPFVDARDPGVFGAVALALVAISVIAAALPAWRASGLDPSQALRSE